MKFLAIYTYLDIQIATKSENLWGMHHTIGKGSNFVPNYIKHS